MAFQQEIRDFNGVAKVGDLVINASSAQLISGVLEDAPCKVGGLVVYGSDKDDPNNPMELGKFKVVQTAYTGANGKVAGIVIGDHLITSNEATDEYPQGERVTVCSGGAVVAVLMKTAAKAGQLVKFADGGFGAEDTAGANNIGWHIVQGCKANGIAFISK